MLVMPWLIMSLLSFVEISIIIISSLVSPLYFIALFYCSILLLRSCMYIIILYKFIVLSVSQSIFKIYMNCFKDVIGCVFVIIRCKSLLVVVFD